MNKRKRFIGTLAAVMLVSGCAAQPTSSAPDSVQTTDYQTHDTASSDTKETAQQMDTAEGAVVSAEISSETADSAETVTDDSKPIIKEQVEENKEEIKQGIEDTLADEEQSREDAGKPTPDNYDNPDKPSDSNDGNASQSSSNKTPDGKYNIAETDLVNTDGTYTQVIGEGTCEVPSAVTEYFPTVTEEYLASSTYASISSIPSQIPYSEITLQNAAEAFPYLGFIGYTPDYIEVCPTDDARTVANKIKANLIGMTHPRYYAGYYSNPRLAPGHFFKSQAEYDAWDAQQKAEHEEAARQDAESKERHDSGNYEGNFDDADLEDLNSQLGLW